MQSPVNASTSKYDNSLRSLLFTAWLQWASTPSIERHVVSYSSVNCARTFILLFWLFNWTIGYAVSSRYFPLDWRLHEELPNARVEWNCMEALSAEVFYKNFDLVSLVNSAIVWYSPWCSFSSLSRGFEYFKNVLKN